MHIVIIIFFSGAVNLRLLGSVILLRYSNNHAWAYFLMTTLKYLLSCKIFGAENGTKKQGNKYENVCYYFQHQISCSLESMDLLYYILQSALDYIFEVFIYVQRSRSGNFRYRLGNFSSRWGNLRYMPSNFRA